MLCTKIFITKKKIIQHFTKTFSFHYCIIGVSLTIFNRYQHFQNIIRLEKYYYTLYSRPSFRKLLPYCYVSKQWCRIFLSRLHWPCVFTDCAFICVCVKYCFRLHCFLCCLSYRFSLNVWICARELETRYRICSQTGKLCNL